MSTRTASGHVDRGTPRSALRLLALLLCVAAAIAALGLLGRAGSESAATDHAEPARLEQIDGESARRIVLMPRAAERLGIELAAVSTAPGATVVRYSALLYDPDGDTWVYTSPKQRVFVRTRVVVERIVGGHAVLSEGPAAGTKIVVVGAAELYGVEFDVGH